MISKETLAAAREEINRQLAHPVWATTTKGVEALRQVVAAAEAQREDFVIRVGVEVVESPAYKRLLQLVEQFKGGAYVIADFDLSMLKDSKPLVIKEEPSADVVDAFRASLNKPDTTSLISSMCVDDAEIAKYRYSYGKVRDSMIPCSIDVASPHVIGELPVNDKFGITVRRMQKDAYDNSKAHGFHGEDEAAFGTQMALIHSEVSEALEAHRKIEPFIKQAVEKTGSQDVPYDQILREAKELQKLAIASELADVLLRCGDTAQMIGVDLDKAVRDKMAFNKTRPFKHGGKAY